MNLLDFENRCQNKYEVSLLIHLCIFGLTTVDLVPKIHISNILFCNLDINKKICFSHILLDFYVTRQNINNFKVSYAMTLSRQVSIFQKKTYLAPHSVTIV